MRELAGIAFDALAGRGEVPARRIVDEGTFVVRFSAFALQVHLADLFRICGRWSLLFGTARSTLLSAPRTPRVR